MNLARAGWIEHQGRSVAGACLGREEGLDDGMSAKRRHTKNMLNTRPRAHALSGIFNFGVAGVFQGLIMLVSLYILEQRRIIIKVVIYNSRSSAIIWPIHFAYYFNHQS